MLTRRALFGFAAACLLDPEKLLWKPGAKLISIPKPKPLLDYWHAYPGIDRVCNPIPYIVGCRGLIIQESMTLAEFRRRYPNSS